MVSDTHSPRVEKGTDGREGNVKLAPTRLYVKQEAGRAQTLVR